MRLGWQCPTCFAELGDKSYAKTITCPFCGSLLIVDPEKKKFYLAKKEQGWYYFPKKYLGDNTGYLKLGEHEEYLRYIDGKWYLIRGEKEYILARETCDCEGEKIEDGEVNYIWGDLPLIAIPGMLIEIYQCEEGVCIKSSKGNYFFRGIR